LGYPKAISFSFTGLVAPKKVAPDRIAKISKAYEKALMDPEMNAKLTPLYLIGNYLPPQEFKEYLVNTFEDVKEIAAEANIRYK
jgi:tripartite-type tricarboxylate transporter receptor subunit TctC